MLRFGWTAERWWNKPLVLLDGAPVPAEIAVLQVLRRHGESGVWYNRPGSRRGAVRMEQGPRGKLRTVRESVPNFVLEVVDRLCCEAGIDKGVPDLLFWDNSGSVRFVEVKCPHWDALTEEQGLFLIAAEEAGYPAEVAEWEYDALDPSEIFGLHPPGEGLSP